MPLDDTARRKAAATKRERTHEAITDAVLRLTADRQEITFANVAREAEVSEATVYRYFPERADLIHVAIDSIRSSNVASAEMTATELALQLLDAVRLTSFGEFLDQWQKTLRSTADAGDHEHRQRVADAMLAAFLDS